MNIDISNNISVSTNTQTTATRISFDNAMLHFMVIMGLYKKPISSIIRESYFNGLDANKKAGKSDLPELVINRQYFICKDEGLGMSQDFVFDHLNVLGESTKKEDDVAVGFFGLGFKSPLSYCPMFYFSTVWEGIKYSYSMYNTDSGSAISLLSFEEDTQEIGTKVMVPIKEADFYTWEQELFEFTWLYDTKTTSKKLTILTQGINWSSSNYQLQDILLQYHNVYYPISYNDIGLSSENKVEGLIITLADSEAFPNQSREYIVLREDVKTIIVERIKDYTTAWVENASKDLDSVCLDTLQLFYQRFPGRSKQQEVLSNHLQLAKQLHINTSNLSKLKETDIYCKLFTLAKSVQRYSSSYVRLFESKSYYVKDERCPLFMQKYLDEIEKKEIKAVLTGKFSSIKARDIDIEFGNKISKISELKTDSCYLSYKEECLSDLKVKKRVKAVTSPLKDSSITKVIVRKNSGIAFGLKDYYNPNEYQFIYLARDIKVAQKSGNCITQQEFVNRINKDNIFGILKGKLEAFNTIRHIYDKRTKYPDLYDSLSNAHCILLYCNYIKAVPYELEDSDYEIFMSTVSFNDLKSFIIKNNLQEQLKQFIQPAQSIQ